MPAAALLLAFFLPVAPARATPAQAAASVAAAAGAEVQASAAAPWTKAAAGQPLQPGARLRTDASGSAVLLFFDGSKVRVGPSTQFSIEEARPKSIAVTLGLGTLEAWVSKLKGRTFQARTGSMVAAVRGTVFSLTPEQVLLFSGLLAVADNLGRVQNLSAGQSLTADARTGAGKPAALPPGAKAPAEPAVSLEAPAAPAMSGSDGGVEDDSDGDDAEDGEAGEADGQSSDSSDPNPAQNNSATCSATASGSAPCP
jgi:hypothetical protein